MIAPPLPPTNGRHRSIVRTEDLSHAVQFYRNVLRLSLIAEGELYAEFDSGEGESLLLVQRDGVHAHLANTRSLAFAVDDAGFDSWRSWLLKRSVVIEREGRLVHGGRSLVVRDPDRVRIEFKTPPEVSPPTNPPMPVPKRPEQD
jgi:catechol 2,3-dioxygenase-like lactoylglutathione lyase family enzyme